MVIEKITPILVSMTSDTWAWVSITTDTGLTGWGEYSGNYISNAAISAIIKVLAKGMQGKNPLDIGKCLCHITGWRYPSHLDSRYVMTALSALDMALWDIRAKHEGVPLHKLLDSSSTRQIRLYANLNRLLRNDRSLEKLVSSATMAIDDGLSMVKIAPFDEVTPQAEQPDISMGIKRLKAVTDSVGKKRVSLDCHCRFRLNTFGAMLDLLGDDLSEIPFIEDPVRIHWARDIKSVHTRYPHVTYSSGEDCFSEEELVDLAESGLLKILNPDIKYIGGVSAAFSIIPKLLATGANVSLHNPSGPVATAHSAHVSAICGSDTMLEFAYGDSTSRNLSVGGAEPVERGIYYLSDVPGIGLKPSDEFLEQYGSVQ